MATTRASGGGRGGGVISPAAVTALTGGGRAVTGDDRPIRLLVADDQRLVRHALRELLDRQPGMTVVAEAATAEETVEQYARHRPDVTLMELRFPDVCGVDAIRDIRAQF